MIVTVGLYKIYEVINKDSVIRFYSSVSSANLKRFTQTANSYKAVGMKARHALDYEPPKKLMTLSEARSIIYLVINEWLGQKEKKLGLYEEGNNSV